MKIQHYAIIFIIIILPFSIICKSKINTKIDSLSEQTRINNALDTATSDAVDTLIELNDEFYALYEGETISVTPTIAKEAINSFFNTLAVNYTLPFTADEKFAENYFSPYIPAVVVVAYDGFYIYSVEESSSGTYEYVLSPKIPYAYEENGYIINFTLGNAIKLYAPNGVLYEGEFKNDYIDSADVIDEYSLYSGILGGDTLNMLPQLTKNMSLFVYGLEEYRSVNPSFPAVPDFLAVHSGDGVSMLRDYDYEHNDETTVSAFHIKRRSVIIDTIVKVLNEKINNHNRYADMMGVTYDFYLPEIDDAEWINAVDDISIMAFVQGLPTGSDTYYNSYALGASRIIEASYIYGTHCYTSSGAYAVPGANSYVYHTSNCPLLDGEFDSDGFPIYNGSTSTIQEMFLNKIDAAKAGYNPCMVCKP